MKITSVNNELVKEVAKLLKRKHRDESGLFLIEGEKGVREAIEAGLRLEHIFLLEGMPNEYSNEIVIETTEAVLSKISDAKSAPKIIAVAQQPKFSLENFKNYNSVILLEGIKDAGNLGTILRTSAAFGIDGIVLYGDTVDIFNPKCVRSTVGCLWKTPVVEIKNFTDLKSVFKDFETVATLPAGTDVISLNDYKPNEKTLVMFGSEADGLTEELRNFASKNLTIEMAPNVESLNLSVSASVVMYKLRKV